MRVLATAAGSFSLAVFAANCIPLLEGALAQARPQAEAKGLTLAAEPCGAAARFDRKWTAEALFNVVDNAVKYNKHNGRVTVAVEKLPEGTSLMVSDTGIGIPQADMDRVFERFYRVDKSHSRETGGTGLGLSIVKHGALLHNAEIHVESEEGKGTKMELIFHC